MVSRAALLFLAGLAALCAATPAFAADLPATRFPYDNPPSRLGAVFADPPPRIVVAAEPRVFVGTALKVPGYYGRPQDFAYRNYYGTSPLTIYGRLPYACGFVGLC